MDKKVELTTLQGGAVQDLFNEEFAKVLANIEDPNTSPIAARKVAITIAIKPDKTRRTGNVSVQVKSTVASVMPSESIVFFAKDDNGKITAIEEEETPVFPELADDKNVIPFPKRQVVNG
jgi:hypothetical protein